MNRRWYVECRSVQGMTALANDVARHLQVRSDLGNVLVVTSSPFSFMRLTRKQWVKIGNSLMRERASTINSPLLTELTAEIEGMRESVFMQGEHIKQTIGQLEVIFAEPSSIRELLGQWSTVYVCAEIGSLECNDITERLADGAVVVLYNEATGF
ncbi:MAG TPA: hypothetical protein VLF60_03055 [Candidatus Saccharimonadales bacterium]|nr:hypothetical protein [Candidatus Saccharimonadales bacterium]